MPPLAAKVWEYAMPAVPVARGEAVLIESSGGLTVSENGLDVICAGVSLSATCIVKLAVTGVVGVPLITPAADNVRPAGNVPDVALQVYGVMPPLAVNVCEYAVPEVAAARGDVVVIESGAGFMMSERTCDAAWTGDPLSVTCTVKPNVPTAVDVPLITPAADNVIPNGRLPDDNDQLYGAEIGRASCRERV